ncbi:MAG: hypothetical protein ACFUZC_00560 [Chthoniobacteraceae bacterium]
MPSSPFIPRVLLGAAFVLSAVAGGQSYLSKGALSKAKDEVQSFKTAAETQQQKDKQEVDAAKAEAAVAVKAKADLEKKISSNTGDAGKIRQQVDALTKQVQSKDTELTDLKKQLADAKNVVIPAATPDPELLKKVADAEAKAKEQETLLKAAQAKADAAEKQASSLEADATRRASTALRPGLEGRILVVNPNWNFVVLNIGDRQGVVSGASMVIKRGGSVIGRVRITSVEPSTAIADIQPGSTKGLSVQPGDVVIFPGT